MLKDIQKFIRGGSKEEKALEQLGINIDDYRTIASIKNKGFRETFIKETGTNEEILDMVEKWQSLDLKTRINKLLNVHDPDFKAYSNLLFAAFAEGMEMKKKNNNRLKQQTAAAHLNIVSDMLKHIIHEGDYIDETKVCKMIFRLHLAIKKANS